ncbi:MAG: dihydrodipicolinate synthase family protein [Bryobacterales bacterium]|nr:dihydrodipicolinate synthase family protein [Bryobacterales bacterium]
MTLQLSRRGFLATLPAAAAAAPSLPSRPLRGIFPIVATPFTESKALDYDDLAKEVAFLEKCGVHGMVWPQLASEYMTLSKEERMRGMEVIAAAAKNRKASLVFGVQGASLTAAMEYLKKAEDLKPDALIAIPPSEAKTIDDYDRYYSTLAESTQRPIFVQTTGGAKGITPSVDFLIALAKKHPNLGYIKEEAEPVTTRMIGLAEARPTIKGVFSGNAGKGMLYEWRLGMDGTMPGSPYSDIYVRIWDAWQAGDRDRARLVFSQLLLMINLDSVVPGARQYVMKRRGVFKTAVSRRQPVKLSPKAVEEIEFCLAALKPYFKA